MSKLDLIKRLEIKAGMISMGEKIAWGSDTDVMYEAAEKIRELEEENKKLKEKIESLKMQIKYCADDNKILHEALNEILDFHDNSNAVAKIAKEAIETVFRD